MIAEKEMLEAWCKSFQHGTCIAVANGSEQAHHTPTNDCMVHARLPRSMIEKSYSRQKGWEWAALSAAAGHQFRSARHPDFRAALEHSSCGGLAGKQFGDRRIPHLYARGPRRPAGVGQDDLYRDLSRHSRRCDDVAKTVASRCCGSDGQKNRRLVALAADCRFVLRATPEGALAHCSLGVLKRFAVSSVSIMLCSND